ncbi:hypothetical protein [Mycolicibacterium sp. F2034L]|uniref:hypothetical protein n=1 Tax=Mycolicibacterium sp. F2034L TaxID=2926422 RepID=UPI001FF25E73|nr:hypothetical protein [Mycolicibacterium sp. F2034L]MCK0174764.1 hypothetical protein [Mycolicibacterium sp. F2034L]
MANDAAAFCFETLPNVTIKATLNGAFMEIRARRDDGLLVGGGGMRCEAVSDGDPSLPPNAAQFTFRTLPGFTFTANLTLPEVITDVATDRGAETDKRADHWIDLKYTAPDGSEHPMGGVSLAGPWDWAAEA